jgi:type I restriction enzyme S subunit
VPQIHSLKTETKFKKTEIGDIPVDWQVLIYSDVSIVNPLYKIQKGAECAFVEMAAVNSDKPEVSYFKTRTFGESGGTRFKEGDTIFARITPCAENGKTGLIKKLPTEFGLGSTEFIVLSPKQNKVDPRFLFYSTKQERVKNYAVARMRGTTGRQRVPNEVFTEELFLAIPPLSEQKKIAEILSTVDEAIEKKKEVIEKTKEMKKGIMQELLTRGIGHKKSKKTESGEIPVDWQVSRIKNHALLITKGTTPTTYGHPYTEKGILFLRVENIGEDGELILDYIKYISEETHNFLSRSKLEPGDILFSIAGTLGRTALVPRRLLPANVNQAIAIIRLKETDLIRDYFRYALQSKDTTSQIKFMAAQLAQANLSLEQIGNLAFMLPPLPEQKNIAEILNSLYQEINKELQNLRNLENIKKGLMQVLLTGKIRVLG